MWSSLQRFVRRACLAASASLVVLGVVATSPVSAADTTVDVLEREFLAQFNAERASRGIAPFELHDDLNGFAFRWSAQMAGSQDLEHSSDGRAEIVGYGPTSGRVTAAFMQSTSHRNLITDPNLGQIGIGVVCDENDRLWVTAQFYRIDRSLGTQRSSSPSPVATSNQSGTGCSDSRSEAIVTDLYQALLARPVEESGLKFWSTRIDNGTSPTGIADRLLASPEYRQRFGYPSNEDFVRGLYRSVLGREGDRVGIRYWTSVLERGMTRGAVASGFATSVEAYD